jgi:SAM-dependent methyltransferase
MMEATQALGVPRLRTQLVEATRLPFPDGAFDVVVAAWMLCHVPSLDETLAEIARVLASHGAFVAVTNGDAHLASLHEAAGLDGLELSFSSENGAQLLARHFAEVSREDISTMATFPDDRAAAAYLDSLGDGLSAHLPPFDGPPQHAGHTTVFVATAPR